MMLESALLVRKKTLNCCTDNKEKDRKGIVELWLAKVIETELIQKQGTSTVLIKFTCISPFTLLTKTVAPNSSLNPNSY